MAEQTIYDDNGKPIPAGTVFDDDGKPIAPPGPLTRFARGVGRMTLGTDDPYGAFIEHPYESAKGLLHGIGENIHAAAAPDAYNPDVMARRAKERGRPLVTDSLKKGDYAGAAGEALGFFGMAGATSPEVRAGAGKVAGAVGENARLGVNKVGRGLETGGGALDRGSSAVMDAAGKYSSPAAIAAGFYTHNPIIATIGALPIVGKIAGKAAAGLGRLIQRYPPPEVTGTGTTPGAPPRPLAWSDYSVPAPPVEPPPNVGTGTGTGEGPGVGPTRVSWDNFGTRPGPPPPGPPPPTNSGTGATPPPPTGPPSPWTMNVPGGPPPPPPPAAPPTGSNFSGPGAAGPASWETFSNRGGPPPPAAPAAPVTPPPEPPPPAPAAPPVDLRTALIRAMEAPSTQEVPAPPQPQGWNPPEQFQGENTYKLPPRPAAKPLPPPRVQPEGAGPTPQPIRTPDAPIVTEPELPGLGEAPAVEEPPIISEPPVTAEPPAEPPAPPAAGRQPRRAGPTAGAAALLTPEEIAGVEKAILDLHGKLHSSRDVARQLNLEPTYVQEVVEGATGKAAGAASEGLAAKLDARAAGETAETIDAAIRKAANNPKMREALERRKAVLEKMTSADEPGEPSAAAPESPTTRYRVYRDDEGGWKIVDSKTDTTVRSGYKSEAEADAAAKTGEGWGDLGFPTLDDELEVHENARQNQAREDAYREQHGIPRHQKLTESQQYEAVLGPPLRVPADWVAAPDSSAVNLPGEEGVPAAASGDAPTGVDLGGSPPEREGPVPGGVEPGEGGPPRAKARRKARAKAPDPIDELIADAREQGYTGDDAALRSHLADLLDIDEQVNGEFNAGNNNPENFLRLIAKHGGIGENAAKGAGLFSPQTGGDPFIGEVKWLKESQDGPFGQVNGVQGVFKPPGRKAAGTRVSGKSISEMVEALNQEPGLEHLTADELISRIQEFARADKPGKGVWDALKRMGVEYGEKWWTDLRPPDDPAFVDDGFAAFSDAVDEHAAADAGDVNEFGEEQGRLGGDVGDVRDLDQPAPEFDAPFSLSGGADMTPKETAGPSLFDAPRDVARDEQFSIVNQPEAKTVVKRAADFADSGNYDVTLADGRTFTIFRDTDQFSHPLWHAEGPGIKPHDHVTGFTKADIIAALERRQ